MILSNILTKKKIMAKVVAINKYIFLMTKLFRTKSFMGFEKKKFSAEHYDKSAEELVGGYGVQS